MSDNIEIRDKLAEAEPRRWRRVPSSPTISFEHWIDQHGQPSLDISDGEPTHPIPNTIDGAAACLREGWEWQRYYDAGRSLWWVAVPPRPIGCEHVRVPDTGDEKADRFALAFAAWDWGRIIDKTEKKP